MQDLAKILERIEGRLEELGLSADAASKLANKKDAIRNMRRAVKTAAPGRKGVNADTIRALAPVLKVSPGWLLSGFEREGGEDLPPVNPTEMEKVQPTELPILGIVEAGAWREITPEQEYVPEVAIVARDKRFPDAEQFLLRVRGDSMNMATPQPFTEGGLARCIPWADTGMALRTGLLVVVRRWNGAIAETTLKRVHEFPDRYELRPESSNPTHKPIVVERNRDDHAEHVDVIALVTGVTYEFEF